MPFQKRFLFLTKHKINDMTKQTQKIAAPDDLKEAAEIIAEQNDLIEQLSQKAKAAPNALPVVQVEGESYTICSGGKFKGVNMSKEEIAKDKDLVSLLIKIGSSIVKKSEG